MQVKYKFTCSYSYIYIYLHFLSYHSVIMSSTLGKGNILFWSGSRWRWRWHRLRRDSFISCLHFILWTSVLILTKNYMDKYEECSKWIAYFYLETSNFKLAQKYSFHALEVLPVARNAKFQPMYPLLEGVTVRWFGHSNKVLMNGRSKCLSGLVFPPSKECFQFRKQKEITWGKVWRIRGLRQNSYMGHNKVLIRFWWHWPNFQGHSSRKTENLRVLSSFIYIFVIVHCP